MHQFRFLAAAALLMSAVGHAPECLGAASSIGSNTVTARKTPVGNYNASDGTPITTVCNVPGMCPNIVLSACLEGGTGQGEPDPTKFISRFAINRLSFRFLNQGLTVGDPVPTISCDPYLVQLSPEAGYGFDTASGQPFPGGYREPLRDGLLQGIVWPFRDGREFPPPHLNAETFFCTRVGNEFAFNQIRGQARGIPTVPGQFVPVDLSLLERGIPGTGGDEPIIPFVFSLRSSAEVQRLLRVEIEGGDADIVTQNVNTGLYTLRQVPIDRSVRLHVVPGSDQPADGHVVNGIADLPDGEYPESPLALQNTETSAGDNDSTDPFDANGSELDALYAKVACEARGVPVDQCTPTLRLFLAGNLRSDGTNIEIFIDFDSGEGQQTLRGDNPNVADNGLNRMGTKGAGSGNASDGPDGVGLTFENGCTPDFYITGHLSRVPGSSQLQLNVHAAELLSSGGGRGWFLGHISQSNSLFGDGLLSGGLGIDRPEIRAAFFNANSSMGIVGGTGLAPATGPESGSEVISGLEFEIPLSAIGGPGRNYRIVAFINGPDRGSISNQVLPGIRGGGALGEPRNVDFRRVSGMQCAALGESDDCFWDNGAFDGRGAQQSQVGADQDWNIFARLTADDFYLCDGQIHFVQSISGRMTTDAVVPKALVAIFPDCDGRPDITRPIAVLSSARPTGLPPDSVPFVDGIVDIRETGDSFDGLRAIEVSAEFDKPVILRGGSYWVSIVGFSGTGNPLEQFFWGTTGNNVVKGRPGQFFDSDIGDWVDVDLLCCGCADFNLVLGGSSCKVLFDNASPRLPEVGGASFAIAATPSLHNGTRTSDRSRSASDIVVPPCEEAEVCYVEGYLWTNCDRAALELYRNDCDEPSDAGPFAGPFEADCIIDTMIRGTAPGSTIELRLLKVQFFRFPQLRLQPGTNVWVSIYALGDNAQNARGFLALGDRCDRECDRLFAAPLVRGPAFASSRWLPASAEFSLYDHAIAVAIRTDVPELVPTAIVPTCAADVNLDGRVSVQDIFDYLATWFAGCP